MALQEDMYMKRSNLIKIPSRSRWYRRITQRSDPRLKPLIGFYRVTKDTDMYTAGEILSGLSIYRQLVAWAQ